MGPSAPSPLPSTHPQITTPTLTRRSSYDNDAPPQHLHGHHRSPEKLHLSSLTLFHLLLSPGWICMRHSFQGEGLRRAAVNTKWNCVLERQQSCTLPYNLSMRPSVELNLYLWWTLNGLGTKVNDVTKAGVFAPHTQSRCVSFRTKARPFPKPPHASRCQRRHEVASGVRAEVASGGSDAGV